MVLLRQLQVLILTLITGVILSVHSSLEMLMLHQNHQIYLQLVQKHLELHHLLMDQYLYLVVLHYQVVLQELTLELVQY